MFIDALTKIYTGKRKPYIYIPYYYEVVFECTIPVIEKEEEERLISFIISCSEDCGGGGERTECSSIE